MLPFASKEISVSLTSSHSLKAESFARSPIISVRPTVSIVATTFMHAWNSLINVLFGSSYVSWRAFTFSSSSSMYAPRPSSSTKPKTSSAAAGTSVSSYSFTSRRASRILLFAILSLTYWLVSSPTYDLIGTILTPTKIPPIIMAKLVSTPVSHIPKFLSGRSL